MPDQIAYKIMTADELEQMRRDGVFPGSSADISDGYVHLSLHSQLAETLRKHFSGMSGLVLATVDLGRLERDTVRWEPSRDGQLFPHVYGPLTMEAVVAVEPLEPTPDACVFSGSVALRPEDN